MTSLSTLALEPLHRAEFTEPLAGIKDFWVLIPLKFLEVQPVSVFGTEWLPSNGKMFCVKADTDSGLRYTKPLQARRHCTCARRVRTLRRVPHRDTSSFDTRPCYA